MIAVQRDHEHRSQIEERKIRDDAAYEEAKRKEKSLLEEKLRQEKAKAEAEVCYLGSFYHPFDILKGCLLCGLQEKYSYRFSLSF